MLQSTRIRTAATPALGVLLAGLFSLGGGATASASEVGTMAHPSGCSHEVAGNWGTVARCSKHNGGSYRAIAVCKDPETGKVVWSYGGWRQYGYSYAYCNGSTRATSAGIESSPSNKS